MVPDEKTDLEIDYPGAVQRLREISDTIDGLRNEAAYYADLVDLSELANCHARLTEAKMWIDQAHHILTHWIYKPKRDQ